MLRLELSDDLQQILESSALEVVRTACEQTLRLQGTVEIQTATLEEIRALNALWREIDEPTDVLSFPQEQPPGVLEERYLGNIVLCLEKVALYGETPLQMVHHGLLHLAGFDHETNFHEWQTVEAILIATYARSSISIPPVLDDSI